MFDYFKQAFGHYQHGIGKFEYESKKLHELKRQKYEENGESWFSCSCEECDFSRKHSKKYKKKYGEKQYVKKYLGF